MSWTNGSYTTGQLYTVGDQGPETVGSMPCEITRTYLTTTTSAPPTYGNTIYGAGALQPMPTMSTTRGSAQSLAGATYSNLASLIRAGERTQRAAARLLRRRLAKAARDAEAHEAQRIGPRAIRVRDDA